jgi:hypothetical protein
MRDTNHRVELAGATDRPRRSGSLMKDHVNDRNDTAYHPRLFLIGLATIYLIDRARRRA